MKNSLESAAETFFISLLRSDSRLKGKSIVHFDEEQKAKSNVIVIEAKQGNHNLAGFGGYDVEVTVEYRAPIGTTSKQNDLVAAALQSIVYGNTVDIFTRRDMARNAGFSDLLIKDESTSERSNTSDLRKRTFTFPLQAKLT